MNVVRFALVTGVVALIGVTAAAAAPTQRPITQADSGRTFRVVRGGHATLRLSNRWVWSDPHVSTKAVELTPVEYFVDPGFREWRITARARGKATIRSAGKPNCPSCKARSFSVTIVVGAG